MLILNNTLIESIENKAASLWMCASNIDLKTEMSRVTGALVEADRKHITMFVPIIYGAAAISNLATTDTITLLTALTHNYISYQVKGKYIYQRPCTDEDIAFQVAYMEGFTDTLSILGLNKQKAYQAYFQQPSIAIRMLAEEVYEQTPKKGTGEKLEII